MGYHVILNAGESGQLEFRYITSLDELLELEVIHENIIVYEGREEWEPKYLKDIEGGFSFLTEQFRAGMRAEKLFKKMAGDFKFKAHHIPQSRASYDEYELFAIDVKQADFIIENAAHVHVEVKCLSKYTYKSLNDRECYELKYSQYKRHGKMSTFNGIPLIFAFYTREKDYPIEESLLMIELTDIKDNFICPKYYNVKDKTLMLLLDKMVPGFELLEKYRVKK